MQKIMWFLYPRQGGDESIWSEWGNLARDWRPPSGVTRWLRSRGRGRGNSFLDPSSEAEGRPVALEEFWVEAAAVDELRSALIDKAQGFSAHLAHLFDLEASHMVTTDDIEVIAGPRVAGQGQTGMALLVPRAGISLDQCVEHWTKIHAAIVVRQDNMTHYSQCPVIDSDAVYAGVPVIHFENDEIAAAFQENSVYLEEQAMDARQFVDMDRNIRFNFACKDGQHEVAL
jgi:hypothetical protein